MLACQHIWHDFYTLRALRRKSAGFGKLARSQDAQLLRAEGYRRRVAAMIVALHGLKLNKMDQCDSRNVRGRGLEGGWLSHVEPKALCNPPKAT